MTPAPFMVRPSQDEVLVLLIAFLVEMVTFHYRARETIKDQETSPDALCGSREYHFIREQEKQLKIKKLALIPINGRENITSLLSERNNQRPRNWPGLFR